MMSLFYSLYILGMFVSKTSANSEYNGRSCYNREGEAILCRPEFVNAAFGLIPESSNTCGVSKRTEYCLQTGVTGANIACHTCDATVPGLSHPASYLTDFNNQHNLTWWQSDTMHSFGDSEAIVNITLNLKKAFDITYIRLSFHSSRPESFAIYKKNEEDGEWIPFQYYSSSCEETFGLLRDETIPRDDETKAICSSEYSNISPLTGGSVAFSTLMGRPGAMNFENNTVLQEFVKASHIRIVLRRMNTFGDEVFGDEKVLKAYFYALTNLAVGARCHCNGHASECVTKTNQNLDEILVCRCQHNTMGPNCQECLPFYNDRPWGRATGRNSYECLPCNCNNHTTKCHFDPTVYLSTGNVSGGVCDECQHNTMGRNCQECKPFYSQDPNKDIGARDACQLEGNQSPCEKGSCYPPTGDLLIGRENLLSASSTCGMNRADRYCVVDILGVDTSCFYCDSRTKWKRNENEVSHRIENIGSSFGDKMLRWWQAENGVEHVSIQFDLEAKFHFTHLVMTFKTLRPKAMFIQKSHDFGGTWTTYGYFAYDCAKSFPGIPNRPPRTLTEVVCVDRYSDIHPSSNGEVIFRAIPPYIPLSDPYSETVQDLLKLTNLRINFTELHTLGDTLLDNTPQIKEKYYYALYSMVVRGGCSCHGHASRCVPVSGDNPRANMVHGQCECTHNTKGLECEQCKDFYNDLPWRPALRNQQNSCRRCNCNNHATKCHFDPTVYLSTGNVSGGVCDECQHNTMGRNCQECNPFYFQDPNKDIGARDACQPQTEPENSTTDISDVTITTNVSVIITEKPDDDIRDKDQGTYRVIITVIGLLCLCLVISIFIIAVIRRNVQRRRININASENILVGTEMTECVEPDDRGQAETQQTTPPECVRNNTHAMVEMSDVLPPRSSDNDNYPTSNLYTTQGHEGSSISDAQDPEGCGAMTQDPEGCGVMTQQDPEGCGVMTQQDPD